MGQRRFARPQRGPADDDVASQHVRRRARRRRRPHDTRLLNLALRLGWQHGSPTPAGRSRRPSPAPSNAFTVYGATPQRDGVIGFQGQHLHRRGTRSSPLRRRHRHRHRQPHPVSYAPQLVRAFGQLPVDASAPARRAFVCGCGGGARRYDGCLEFDVP